MNEQQRLDATLELLFDAYTLLAALAIQTRIAFAQNNQQGLINLDSRVAEQNAHVRCLWEKANMLANIIREQEAKATATEAEAATEKKPEVIQ